MLKAVVALFVLFGSCSEVFIVSRGGALLGCGELIKKYAKRKAPQAGSAHRCSSSSWYYRSDSVADAYWLSPYWTSHHGSRFHQTCMTKVTSWFDRKFEFTFPAELFPNLRTRLCGTPARLEEMLSKVSHEALIAKPGDAWSVQEHAGHLLDLEALWLRRVEDFLAGRDELTVADLRNRKTHEANHNATPLNGILSQIRTARGRLLASVDGLEPAEFTKAIPHPRLKTPMRLLDHLYFAAEHDDHHIARMWELLQVQRT